MNFDYSDIIKDKDTVKGLLEHKVVISIITAAYNTKKYMEDTAKCLINQTFPYFEWLIVDDGSKDEESLAYLENIAKMDDRIKLLHKENTGLANTRDFGVEHSNSDSKYIIFVDDDDILDNTYLECAYWTLETNQEASWAFTDVVHFGKMNYLSTTRFDPEEEKKSNNIVATALIRKSDFLKVGGYGLKEKNVNEDWNLWLKMIAEEMFPVRMSFFGFWYRRKESNESELARSKKNAVRAKKIISETIKTIKKTRPSKEYPIDDYNWDLIEEKVDGLVIPKYKKNNKINILMIIPWMTVGGADKFNIDLCAGLDEEKFEITLITTEPNLNPWREKHYACTKAIYDLTSFLDKKYWISFINYIIEKNNINLVLNTNSTFGYSVLPYLKSKFNELPIVDYIHMEEWYNRNGGYSRDSSAIASVIDKTYVCNENSKKILINHFGRKEEDIQTVYIGVDSDKFNPEGIDKNEIKKKYNIPQDKKIIGFIARIALQKRPFLLVEIIKKLKEKRDDFLLVVGGNGPMLKEIENLCKKYKLEKNIKFLGTVSNTKEIYSICDLTLNCSIKEGLALSSYESLSMGIPVISSNVGGQAELIDENVGVIVPCLQKEEDLLVFEYSLDEINNYVVGIEKIFSNLDFYKKNAREKILNGFTIKQMIENMSNELENIVKNPNKEKIKNGKNLSNCIDICKELNNKYLVAFKNQYQWEVNEANNQINKIVRDSCSVHYTVKTEQNEKENKNSVFDKIKYEGKRKFFGKLFIKLHIFHEMNLVYEICQLVYSMLKAIYKFVKFEVLGVLKIVYYLIKLIFMIFIRILNVFLKIFNKNINFLDKK